MKKLILLIKSLIFDNTCVICKGKSDDNLFYICYNCLKKLKYTSSLKKNNEFYYIWNYDENFKKLIYSYKFTGKKALVELISDLVKEKLEYVIKKENIDYIIAVPISNKRKRTRGFNQVEELLKKCNVEYLEIKRKNNTKHMYSLTTIDERENNIKDSFEITKNKNLKNKKILIVDDIITTGATFREINRELNNTYKIEKTVFFTLAAVKASFVTK